MALEKSAEVLSTPMLNLDFFYYLIYLFFKWVSSPFTSETSSFGNLFRYMSGDSAVTADFLAFDKFGNPITAVYDKFGNQLTSGYDQYGEPIKNIYDATGNPIGAVYDKFGESIDFPFSQIGSLGENAYDQFGNGIGALYDGYSLFHPPHGLPDFGGISGWWESFTTNPYCADCPSFFDLFFGGVNTWLYGLVFLGIVMLVYLKIRQSDLAYHESVVYDTVYEKNTVEKSNQKGQRWEKILSLINSDNENDWKVAIMDAENLLEEALDEQGMLKGSVGDSLKVAKFNSVQNAWKGHIIRNKVAHDSEYVLTQRDAKSAISNFGQVFSEFYHL